MSLIYLGCAWLAGIFLGSLLPLPVVRAAIMGCLYVIATHYGRQTDALTSLVATAKVSAADGAVVAENRGGAWGAKGHCCC